MASNSNCIVKPISGAWLTNGHLKVCLLKLIQPEESQYEKDESREDNLAIIDKLFSPATDKACLLEEEAQGQPILLLAPELAFGSSDYGRLNQLITEYSQDLIFIGGFGFTKGSVLIELVAKSNVEGAWERPPNKDKIYNCGWAWVKYGSDIRCYIFLKNFPEQYSEISIANISGGSCILRLESSELIIFPLICADLISNVDNNPRNKIIASINSLPTTAKKVLITGSLLNGKSYSVFWKSGIGDLLESSSKAYVSRLLLSNCVNPHPLPKEDEDKWRCLSGCYQYVASSHSPKKPLPSVRFISDTKFSGLVVRTPIEGCVFGELNWSNSPVEGFNVLSPVSQFIWNEKKLNLADGLCVADELFRFMQRYGKGFFDNVEFNTNARHHAERELQQLLDQLSPIANISIRNNAEKIIIKCLSGGGIKKDFKFNCDDLHAQENTLESAIITLVFIRWAIDAELLPNGKDLKHGQLLSSNGDYEVLVWHTSEYSPMQLYHMIADGIVAEGGSALPLFIIGRGKNFGRHPSDGRVISNRLKDISSSSQNEDICNSKDRVVFWRNQGSIDDILSSTDPAQNLKEELKNKISLEGI